MQTKMSTEKSGLQKKFPLKYAVQNLLKTRDFSNRQGRFHNRSGDYFLSAPFINNPARWNSQIRRK
jgi:hypothetical protein